VTRRRITVGAAMATIAGLALLLGSYRAGRDAAELPELVWITRTGRAYHRPDCRHVVGRGVRVTLTEAAGAYRPCRVCRPPEPAGAAEGGE
jgi:hypothetical protein